MPRTPWAQVEAQVSRARADREQLDAIREKQGELSQTLAEKAYEELAKRGVTEVAETLPEDLSTIGPDAAQPLPTCPPEVRTRMLLESRGSGSAIPPEILDLLIRTLEEADGIDLPGLGRLAGGRLTIDVPTLACFHRIHQRRQDAAASG